jgi:hypothetical protein
MLWIVLPPAVGGQCRGAIACADIRVAIEIVIAINVDVVAAPPAVPAITPAPKRSHRHTNTERDCHACGVIPRRRIVDRRIRIDWRTVHRDWIIGGHIHNLRTRRLDDDYTFVIDRLRLHLLLFGRLQIALLLGLLPHALHGRHHITLLREKGIPQVSRPLDIVGEPFRDVRNSRKRLNAWVPRLFGHCVG